MRNRNDYPFHNERAKLVTFSVPMPSIIATKRKAVPNVSHTKRRFCQFVRSWCTIDFRNVRF